MKTLPPVLTEWTLDTVSGIVKDFEFEPDWFDFKAILNPKGEGANKFNESVCKTACSMANTNGGWIIFGVQDRGIGKVEDRITGIPLGGDLLAEFSKKVSNVHPPIMFESIPKPLPIPESDNGIFVVRIEPSSLRPHMTSDTFYKRSLGGTAEPMTHNEIREQMIFGHERLRKLNLLRLELSQFLQDIDLIQEMEDGTILLCLLRFDTRGFKQLVADVCGLIPPTPAESTSIFRALMDIPRCAELVNKFLDQAAYPFKIRQDGKPDPDVQRRKGVRDGLIALKNCCEFAKSHLDGVFGSDISFN